MLPVPEYNHICQRFEKKPPSASLLHAMLSNNMHHDCTGEHCEICLEIEMAEQLISGIKTLFTLSFGMAVLCVFAHIFTKTKEEICVKNTLISLKVELLD